MPLGPPLLDLGSLEAGQGCPSAPQAPSSSAACPQQLAAAGGTQLPVPASLSGQLCAAGLRDAPQLHTCLSYSFCPGVAYPPGLAVDHAHFSYNSYLPAKPVLAQLAPVTSLGLCPFLLQLQAPVKLAARTPLGLNTPAPAGLPKTPGHAGDKRVAPT